MAQSPTTHWTLPVPSTSLPRTAIRGASRLTSRPPTLTASITLAASVALDGDTLAVGAPIESSRGTGVNSDTQSSNSEERSGAVYVFARGGDTWRQQAYVKASNTGAEDLFGISVALHGDRLVVGASGEASNGTGVDGDQSDNSSMGAGAAYMFTRSAGTWRQQIYLKALNAGGRDRFGSHVALDGDTLVAGAPGEQSNATGVNSGNGSDDSADGAGAVYIFR